MAPGRFCLWDALVARVGAMLAFVRFFVFGHITKKVSFFLGPLKNV